MADVVILFALRREMAPFQRVAPRGVGVVHCGIGPANVEAALRRMRPAGVILAGFSGGLDPTLAVGDILAASEVRTLDGAVHPVTMPLVAARTGPILAADRILSTRREKADAHAATGAIAVDLESAACAIYCQEAGVPFGCLRAISDAAGDELPPELADVVDGERLRPWRLLRALWRRPGLVGDLIRLARATREAADNLARALCANLAP